MSPGALPAPLVRGFRHALATLVRAALPAAILIALVLVGRGANALVLSTWNAFVGYETPHAAALPPGPGGAASSRRVVLVVVDGLRVDAFERMRLRERYEGRAARWRAWVEEPTLSLPGWTAIATGAPPEISGVTTNWYEGAVRVDTIFAAAKRAGRQTAVAGSPGWDELFAGTLDAVVLVMDPPYDDLPAIHDTTVAVTGAGERFLREGTAQLVVLHYPAPDLMGHGFGGASQPYADAVRLVDEELSRLIRGLDLAATTVIVTSDHGHTDSGGHGGGERVVREVPLFLFGAGIAPGPGLVARHADIAPTVAALLGLSLPAHSVGRPLVEALAATPDDLDARWREQQARFYDAYAQRILGRHAVLLTTPLRGPAEPDAIATVADDIARQVAGWKGEALRALRLRRLPVALLLALLPAALFLARRPRRDLLPASIGAGLYLGLSIGLFFGRGYRYSLSIINREDFLQPFFQARALDAALALVAGALVAGFAARRRTPGEGATVGITTGYLALYALVAQSLAFYVLWGIRFPWYLPDLGQGLKFYLDLLGAISLGKVAPALVVVGFGGYGIGRLWEWSARRRAQRREQTADARA